MQEYGINESWPVEDETVKQRYSRLKELGDCHTAVENHSAANMCYQKACELAPEESGAYVGLGVLAFQSNRLDDARRSFEVARHLDPLCAEAYGGLAMVHQKNQNYPSAFQMYLKCLELNTDNLMALLGLFQTSCQMGTFSKIIHYLEVFLDTHHDDTAVLFCLATLYARDNKFMEAGKALRKVLELEPDKIEAAKLLAQVTDSLAKSHPQEMALA